MKIKVKIGIIAILVCIMFILGGCAKEDSPVSNGENQGVEFSEEWYREYPYFESEEGDTLKIDFYDTTTWFAVFVNGTDLLDSDRSSYTKDSNGAYVYKAEVGGGELKYYPKDGNYIVFTFDGISTKYYPAEKKEFIDDGKYYVSDSIMGNDIGVHVWFAYTEKEYGNMYVNVLCEIVNYSGEELTLATDRYFSLNNNGIIKTGYCDYDYSRMANNATVSTWITFMYPDSANTNLSNMTMNIDGVEVMLADKPQSEDELKLLEGMYYLESSSNRISIEQISQDTYVLIEYMYYFGINIYEFTLNADNTFIYNGHKCTWNPESHSFTNHFSGHTYYKK